MIEKANLLEYMCFTMITNLFLPGRKTITPVCIGTAFPFWSNALKSEPVQRKLQNIENNEGSKPLNRTGMMQLMDTKCTAHGLAMMSFVFTPAGGQAISVARSYQP